MNLLERRRAMMARSESPEIVPIYSAKNIAFPTGDTTTYTLDTGLMLFQEDKSYTILTEFYYETKGVGTFPWFCGDKWCFRNHQGTSWDSYISGANPWGYYGSGSSQTGRVRRVYQTYDSISKNTIAQMDGISKTSKSVSTFVPATETLKIAKKNTWHPLVGEVRSIAIYDTLLSDDYLTQWLADTPTA